MRYTQIRNLLDQVRELHGQLAEYYKSLSVKADQRRVALLLDYLSSHERNLQASLADYEEEASRKVLDTWVDCSHLERMVATCAPTALTPDTGVDGVTHVAMDVDECLMQCYQEIADNAESDSVREVFRNLMAMEQAELRKLARNALAAGDL
jgi:hypothetical protein